MIRTVAEARKAAADEPARWKVAVVEATSTPLLDSADAKVQLFRTKKRANEVLRERYDELKDQGFKLVRGNLGLGVLWLERAGETVGLGLDYRGRLAS